MPRYRITESVGSHVEHVDEYSDLAKHHPSSGRQRGRSYETIDGQLEEVRHLPDGRTFVKKDFILAHDGAGPVNVPAPVAGYVHYLRDETNAVRLYDRPFGEPGARLLAQSLHMAVGTSPPEGTHVAYGQPLGRMGDTGSRGSFHAHVEMEPAAFRGYVHDISSGAITTDRYPAPSVTGSTPAAASPSAPSPPRVPSPSPSEAGRAVGAAGVAATTESTAAGAAGTTELSNLIGRGEGGYDSYNRGHAGDARAPVAVSGMTIGAIMQRQSLPASDPDRLFAVGKFQMVPGTMAETVRALHIDPSTRFTPALQDRMFAEHLIDGKRPQVHDYITGASSGAAGLQGAQLALAREFASVADPRTGRSYYDGDSAGNRSSITATQTQSALDAMRTRYHANVQAGMTPDRAYAALGGGAAQPAANAHGDVHAPRTRPNPVLREGDDTMGVISVQRQLNALGVRDAQGRALVEDHDFGPRTRQAVESFQRSQGLRDDGVVGRDTFAALRSATASHRPDASVQGSPAAAAPTPPAATATATPREALLSDACHPRHPMYEQAMAATGRLPTGTFRNEDERRNASATLVFEAGISGLRKIDAVMLSGDGKGLIAVDGALNDPAHHRVYTDRAQATAQTVEHSTQQLRQDAALAPQQLTMPVQAEEQVRRPAQIA